MKDIIIIKWSAEHQKYLVGGIHSFIDHKGNEFLDSEFCFPTDKTPDEIFNFLVPKE